MGEPTVMPAPPPMSDAEKAATWKVRTFVERSVVLLTDTPQGVRSRHPASGTLIRSASGAVGVLTAAHALPSTNEALTVHVEQGVFIEDAIEHCLRHPDAEVDVGIAKVREDVANALRARALTLQSIELSRVHRVEAASQLVVAGFPQQFQEDAELDEGVIEHRFAGFIYWSRTHGHDDRLLSIKWREGFTVDRETVAPHPLLRRPPDQPLPLKKPRGISGGPVFRVRSNTAAQFSPENDVHLIGVAIEFDKESERAAPWWRWERWVSAWMLGR